ncbi:MAG: hypothetical protein LJE61_04865 [Thiocapsa sp.]|nr:hypothetical protein [Thiocapsa sp.]MCG6984525.1 hypothetical protein [Thiocapsa sp.]
MNKITNVVLGAVACCTAMVSTPAAQADVNVPALECVAPFLNQAFPMRWHEHYLLNPLGNQATWVVCPLSFEHTALPQRFAVAVFGVKQPGTTQFHRCVVNFIDLFNEDIPGVSDNPAQNLIASGLMANPNQPGQRWVSVINATIPGVTNAIGGGCGPACWTISVNCLLPPGFAVQMISLIGTQ